MARELNTTVTGSLAAALGRLIHLFARLARSVAGVKPAPASSGRPSVAVLCESFVRYSTAQAVGLQQAGADVTLYYVDRLSEFDDDETERDLVLKDAVEAGVRVVKLPARNMRRLASQTRDLHRDLASHSPEWLVVHAHIDPRYATLGLRFRVLAFVHDPRPHSGDYESAFPVWVRALQRLSEVMSDRLLLHSDRLVPDIVPFLRSVPVTVIPHGTLTADAPMPIPAAPRLVLTGRLMEYKGIDVALEAFADVQRVRPDSTLVLAGRGQMGEEIRRAAPANVELVDRYLTEEEMDELLNSATLVLLPYRDATQSGVGLQALGRGIPCAVSDAGALPDLVPPSMPTLVSRRGESASLATSILSNIDQTAEHRDEVLEFARTNFDWKAVGRSLLAKLGTTPERGEQHVG